MDEEGNTATEVILSLETKSVQPYKTQDEYLYAMKEDLAEWFNTLYGLDISVENFFEQLETGVVLCQHANNVQSFILERLIEEKNGVFRGKKPLPKARDFIGRLPEKGVSYRSKVRTGSFQARDNISNFITWCRGLGIDDVLMFETDDLVLRKNERSVVLCLLEVARRGAKYGMLAPKLIQFEEEIDAEIAGEEPLEPPAQRITCDLMSLDEMVSKEEKEPPPPPKKPPKRRRVDLVSLDEMVREMVSLCTCPDQFPVIRVSEGKYQVGDSRTLIFVRILRNHVMVRIGGGWDTLQNYLNRHDPCRCGSKGHKITGARANTGAPSVKRKTPGPTLSGNDPRTARSFTPEPQSSQGLPQQRSKRSHSLHPGAASYDSAASLTGRSSPQKGLLNRSLDTAAYEKTKSAHKGFLNKSFDGTSERVRRPSGARSTTPTSEPTSPKSQSTSTTPSPRSEAISPIYLGQSGRKTSLVITEIPKSGAEEQSNSISIKQFSSTKGTKSSSKSNGLYNNLSTPKKNTTPARPMSARERGRTNVVTPGPYGLHSRQRSRSRERTMSEGGDTVKTARSRSVGATELGRQLNKSGPLSAKKGSEVLMVSRDESGKHCVTPIANGSSNNNNNVRNGDEFKRPMTPRVQITPDRILPDKPKFLNRSQSAESSDSSSNGTSNNSPNGTVSKTPGKNPPLSKTSRSFPFSSSVDEDDDLEPPPEDPALYEKMERLFQEYLKLELGTNGEDTKYTFSPPSRSRKASESSEGSGSISSYNSYSTRSASSFQKSCSSSREDILTSSSTSGRSSPAIINGSPKRGPYLQTPSASKHSTNSRNTPGTPKSTRKAVNTREDIVNANRPSTPARGRSNSLTRTGSRPSSAASSDASSTCTGPTNRRPVTPRARTSSREDLLDGNRPRERGRTPVRTMAVDKPQERGRTPTRTNNTHERGRTPTMAVDKPQERGRTPTRTNNTHERGRTPTRTDNTHERGRTPTRRNSTHERGRTPTRTDNTHERGRTPTRTVPNQPPKRGRTPTRGNSTAEPAAAAVRARSRSRDVLGRNAKIGHELTVAPVSTSSSKSLSTPRPASAQVRSRSRDILGDNSNNQRAGARTPLPQKTQPKPATPARPALARANPYQQRRGSREDLLDGGRTKAQKVSTPVRPASARANPYHQRSRSREDLLDGDSQADRSRTRAVTNASRQRSASTTVIHRNKLSVNEDKAAQTSPPYNVLPGQLDLDLTLIESRLTPKPRKDEKPGRTKIPMPNAQRLAQSDSGTPLKRFDSGVDIATISPTESSIHGDDMWQNDLLSSKMAQAGATFSHSVQNAYEQPNLTYNCFDDDDDSEYF